MRPPQPHPVADRPFADLLSTATVRVGVDVHSKADLLALLVDAVADDPVVRDRDELLDAVEQREARMSTGVGDGLALPHAYHDAVAAPVAALATLSTPLAFEAFDGEPVRMAVLLAGPASGRTGHVRLLSRVSRVLGQATVRDEILDAADAEAVLAILFRAEAALS